jgi:hypothetical protein
VLVRYNYHRQVNDFAVATHWLITGIDLESHVYSTPEVGSCYRLFTCLCVDEALHLMQIMAEDDVNVQLARHALDIVAVCRDAEIVVFSVPALSVLLQFVNIFNAILESDFERLATNMIEALRLRNKYPMISFRPWLLMLATKVLENEDMLQRKGEVAAMFGVEGISHLLLLMQEDTESLLKPDERQKVQSVLGRALSRAYMLENGKRAISNATHRASTEFQSSSLSLLSLRSADVLNLSPSEQDILAEQMLNP